MVGLVTLSGVDRSYLEVFSMVDIFSGFDSGRQAWVLTVVVVVIFSLCINVSRDYSYIS